MHIAAAKEHIAAAKVDIATATLHIAAAKSTHTNFEIAKYKKIRIIVADHHIYLGLTKFEPQIIQKIWI